MVSMLFDPVEDRFSPKGDPELSAPRVMSNLGVSEYREFNTASQSRSNTISEARSWSMPALVQDLASFFISQSKPNDPSEGTLPSSSNLSSSRGIQPLPPAFDDPSPLPVGLQERKAKTRTNFMLAHPPPIGRSKQILSARPRMILQLQRLAEGERPMPAFDLISSSAFASRFTRHVPKLLKGDRGASTDTLVLLRSDLYGQGSKSDDDKTTEDSGEDATNHHRDYVGTINYASRAKDASTTNRDQICLGNGLVWEANCLKEGVYEFSGKTHAGLKLRWVRGRKTSTQRNSLSESTKNAPWPRLTFSIIHPETRLHPVIATLTADNKLSILDQFSTFTSSATASPPSSAPQSPLSSEFSYETSYFEGVSPYTETDEALRVLIILTGIWAMSKEGWSEAFSKNLEMVQKPRPDSKNASPSTTVSGTETILERSLVSRHPSTRLHRPSTSPLSHQVVQNQMSSTGRAKSTGALGNEMMTVKLPQSGKRCKPAVISSMEPCNDHRAIRCKSTLDASAFLQTSSLTPRRPSDASNYHNETRSNTAHTIRRENTQEVAPQLFKVRRASFDSESVNEGLRKDLRRQRATKSARFQAACKAMIHSCIKCF